MVKFEWVKDDRENVVLFETKIGRKVSDDFVMDWVSNLGWKKDPFRDGMMSPLCDFITGLDEERKQLNLFIVQNNRFGTIRGASGLGKTTLLIWLFEELDSYKDYTVVYLPAKELKYDFFLEALLEPLSSRKKPTKEFVYSRFRTLGGSEKKMLLLIDDAEELSSEHLSLVRDIFLGVKEVRIIMTFSEKGRTDFGEDQLSITLREITPEDAVGIIEKRVENAGGNGVSPLNPIQVKNLYKKTGGDIRKLFSLCSQKAMEVALGGPEIESEDLEVIEDDIKKRSRHELVYNETHKIEPSERLFEGDKIVQEILKKSNKRSESGVDDSTEKNVQVKEKSHKEVKKSKDKKGKK